MAKNIAFEKYDNIYRFMDTIMSRPNNGKFGESSQNSGRDFAGMEWDEAVTAFQNGLPEKAKTLQKGVNSIKCNSNVVSPHRRPQNYYHGYAPNVPAAIIGLPKSMRRVERTPQKVKAVSIYFDSTANCGVTADTLEKAGTSILQLVYIMERAGYRVKLDLGCYNASEGSNDFAICLITLKEWRQPLDILKLSFPITSPAMFRRFGFKWAEGVPNVKKHFSGYGSHISKTKLIECLTASGVDTRNTFVIEVDDCKEVDFDAMALAKNIGIVL